MKNNDRAGNPTDMLPDIVKRAAIILARQTPVGALASQALDAGGEALAAQAVALPGAAPIEQLRARAMDLVGDLFAGFGANAGPGRADMPGMAWPATAPAPVPAAVNNLPGGLYSARGPAPIAAGRSTVLPLQVENRGNQPVQTSFYSTDLLNELGHAIPAHAIAFEPPSLTLRPGERGTVNARIGIPLQAISGAYSGLVQATGLPSSKAVITIDVS